MNRPKNVLAIIPIRGADKEFREDAHALLGGKPLIGYTIQSAKASRWINKVVVSTDSQKIAGLARSLGAEIPFLRPTVLSDPEVSLTEVLKHCLEFLEKEENYVAEIVVLLEVTHPLRPAGLIDEVVDILVRENLDTVFVAREERHEFWAFDPSGKLIRVGEDEQVLGDHYLPREKKKPLYKEMGGLATAVKVSVIRHGRRLGDQVGLVPLRDAASLVDLHDEDGIRLAEALLQKRP